MRFHRLDLNLLVALDALLTYQNVTRASERLCLSQSAMSGCLARLRAHFGDELIVQAGRRMVLTPLGQSLAHPLRELLTKTETLITAKPAFDPASSDRTFVVIMSDYAAQVLMVGALQRIAREAPRVKVTIDRLTESTSRTSSGARTRCCSSLSRGPSRTGSATIYSRMTTCALPGQETRRLADLSRSSSIFPCRTSSPSFHSESSARTTSAIERLGYQRNLAVTTPNFTPLPLCVIGTDRIATVHARLAKQYAHYLPLRILPPPIKFPVLREVLQWQPHLASDPGLALVPGAAQAFGARDRAGRSPAASDCGVVSTPIASRSSCRRFRGSRRRIAHSRHARMAQAETD